MELYTRMFTPQEVATATGLEAKSIHNWATRGLIVGQRDAVGKGHTRMFSWFNVMEVAVAAALMEIGMNSPQDAFAGTRLFSHSGDGGSGWAQDDAIADDDDLRLPALPYHHSAGVTFLFVWKEGAEVRLSKDGTIDLHSIRPEYSRATGFIVLNLSELFARVAYRLGCDYRVLLDQAYEK